MIRSGCGVHRTEPGVGQKGESPMTKERSVVLRDTRDEDGTRYLEARIEENGDLTIQGQDLGAGVESYFGPGTREYEWCWTIRSPDLPRLREALKAGEDVLAALHARFSGDAAAGLSSFLKEEQVPYESWSRVGD